MGHTHGNFNYITLSRLYRNVNTITILITTFIIASSWIREANGEYFSSMDKMMALSNIEDNLVEVSKKYLALQEANLVSLQSYSDSIKREIDSAEKNVEDYVGNPINAFTLLRRVVFDWLHISNLTQESSTIKEFKTSMESLDHELELPTDDDFIGAVKGISRLQEIYNLKPKDLMKGIINGVQYNSELSWEDSWEIGLNLFNLKDFKRSLGWFKLTLEKLQGADFKNLPSVKVEIYENIAAALYELGFTDTAIAYLDRILEISRLHSARNTKEYFLQKKKNLKSESQVKEWFTNYTRLCRGIQIPEKHHHKLYCTYDSKRNVAFLLAPLKVEYYSLEPKISLYHNLLTDKWIDEILELARLRMQRSMVYDADKPIQGDVRISQQAWLEYDNIWTEKLKKLLIAVTGFNFDNSELIQMANYGIGGQFDPHHDFLDDANVEPDVGNRVATTMFYLSDVEQGGYTVYPYLNIFSKPEKGSLIVWENLHKSLAPDYRTLHAGCPVIKGSKRIGNVWFHSAGQEFTRPCELTDDAFKSAAFVDLY